MLRGGSRSGSFADELRDLSNSRCLPSTAGGLLSVLENLARSFDGYIQAVLRRRSERDARGELIRECRSLLSCNLQYRRRALVQAVFVHFFRQHW